MVAYYKPDLFNLIVVYDDVDLPMGRIRIRPSGSAGTITACAPLYMIFREDFPGEDRNRGERKMRLADYVTGGFRKEEKKLMEMRCCGCIRFECIIEKGFSRL